jgi:hypothetical protein
MGWALLPATDFFDVGIEPTVMSVFCQLRHQSRLNPIDWTVEEGNGKCALFCRVSVAIEPLYWWR